MTLWAVLTWAVGEVLCLYVPRKFWDLRPEDRVQDLSIYKEMASLQTHAHEDRACWKTHPLSRFVLGVWLLRCARALTHTRRVMHNVTRDEECLDVTG